MAKQSKKDFLFELLKPRVEALGYRCVDVEYGKVAKDWVLTLYIDKEGGIGLDDCEAVSRPISDFLDEADPIEHSYIFEVSSPGLDRPFKRMEDYTNALGTVVDVYLYQSFNGEKMFVGELIAVDESSITLTLSEEETITFKMNEISKTAPHLEF